MASDDEEALAACWFDPKQPTGHVLGGNLPHWRQEGVQYFVTWRTLDSMPKDRVALWAADREAWLRDHPQPHERKAETDYDRLFNVRWEKWLDQSHGECLFQRADLRQLVWDALRHFDKTRYRLGEFVVAPNHVHVLVIPLGGHTLSAVVQNWKSYCTHEINKTLRRTGAFWAKEYFDHVVRSPKEQERIEEYIRAHRKVDAASPPRLDR